MAIPIIGEEEVLDSRMHTVKVKVGKCDCGEKVLLMDSYQGATSCSNCGQWYNIFGQKLKKPKHWEED